MKDSIFRLKILPMRSKNLQFQPINALRYATSDLSTIRQNSSAVDLKSWSSPPQSRSRNGGAGKSVKDAATSSVKLQKRKGRTGDQEKERGRIYSIRDIYYTVIAVRRLWSHTSRGIELRPFIVSITMDGL